MIRITKPATPPELLTERGPARVAEHSAALAAGSELEFERELYAHASVVRALVDAQHRKCCYCERTLGERERDVEHFRPKAAWRQGVEHDLVRPGYYWLAYEWSNLYLACRPCNQQYKRALFPLAHPSARVCSPGSTDVEAPLLIDPGQDDPEAHIDFDEGDIAPRAGSERGLATIRVTELARRDLNADRRHRLESYKVCVSLTARSHRGQIELLPEDRADIADALAAAVDPSAPFAGMMRAYLRRQLGTACIPNVAELIAYMSGDELPQ